VNQNNWKMIWIKYILCIWEIYVGCKMVVTKCEIEY